MGEIIDVSAKTNLSFWNWSTEVTSSLLMSLLVSCLNETMVVHDWMPKGELHIADQFENSIELFLGEPFSLVGKE